MDAFEAGAAAAILKKMRLTVLLLPAFILLCAAPVGAETLTYPDLVHRLTDMKHLAVLPPDGERGGLASSYDRASRYDAALDKYVDWGANNDGKGVVGVEGDRDVLAEIRGPGCIWRIWSAAPDLGHVRIYLDGSTTPAVDETFENYFSTRGPFRAWPNLSYSHAGERGDHVSYNPGSNCYVPIPFNKSCRIVGDRGDGVAEHHLKWGQYFQFTWTRFAPGTDVPTFALPIAGADAAALTEANRIWGHCEPGAAAPEGSRWVEKDGAIPPGGVAVAAEIAGERAITLMKIRTPLPEGAEAQRELLRQLTIRIAWDGQDKPAVWSPLGDFFGAVGGAGAFATLPVGLTSDGTFYCRWYMPFARSARVELGNDGPAPVAFRFEAAVAPLDRPIATLGRFHAKWHRDAFNPTRPDRAPDWTLLTTRGRGRYVGSMLHVWNPDGGWWGEGDEKFFVDGEKFPSYFGTGSEDFFGYAWGSAARFVRAMHAQPLNENNIGHVDDMRWMIPDNVPFHTSFEGCLEKYPPNAPAQPFAATSLEAAISYWYLSADGTDPYGPTPLTDRVGYWKRSAQYNEPGAIEGETLEQQGWTEEEPRPEAMWGAGPGGIKGTRAGVWSGDMQLGWHPTRPGQRLALKFPVEKAGRYKVILRLTRAPGGGAFDLGIDGQSRGGPVNLSAKEYAPADPFELGELNLGAGRHVLNVTARAQGAFGLDYVKLVPLAK